MNYNVKSYLQQALVSIQKSLQHIPSEIFVVDNASSDGSVEMVKRRFPDVRLIANEENVGFATANNQALRLAHADMVCLINPDTLVQEDTFSVCLAYMKSHGDVGMLGCKILNGDGTLQLACRRSFPTPWVAFTKSIGLSALFPKSRLFGRYNLTYLDPDEIAEVEAISGSFMVVRKTAAESSGFLDESFFLYGEDLDWCYRIREAGWKIMYLPATQIMHFKGRSAKSAPVDNLREFYRAMHLFVQKHFRQGWAFFPKWLLTLGIWLRGGVSFLTQTGRRMVIPGIDLIFLQIGLFLAILIWLNNLHYWPRYLIINLLYSLIWLGCFKMMGLYKPGILNISSAIGGVLMGFLVNTSLTFFLPQYQFSRAVLLIASVLNASFLSGWRILARLSQKYKRFPLLSFLTESFGHRRVAVVGTNASSRRIYDQLKHQLGAGYEVVGLLAVQSPKDDVLPDGIPILGKLNRIEEIARVQHLHEVVFPHQSVSYEHMMEWLSRGKALHVDFKMVPEALDVIIGRTSIDSIEDVPLVDLQYRIHQGVNPVIKRMADLIGSLLLLPVAVPFALFLILHPAYRFKKEAISDGYGGRCSIYRVCRDQQKAASWLQCVPLLPRILAGRISFIGTELMSVDEAQNYRGFKPGVTGMVHINRNKTLTESEKKQLTLYYLKNYTPFLDLEILFRALFATLFSF